MKRKTPKVRFHNTPLHKRKEPHALKYIAQRSTFWVATLSVMAFMAGNMVGQHGWYTFWKSVWGRGGDASIVFTGTVTPIESVPNYLEWSRKYGGDPHVHTYRQVPEHLLIPLPSYNPAEQSRTGGMSAIGQVYSVGYSGAYDTGGELDGSHPGIDIRVPVGTPIRSIANGIVDEVRDISGFGTTVVIRHPNVPDPANPRSVTVLYSSYAHLSAAYVEEGQIIQKGERVALSGQSGFVSGPHLHFQIDRDDAPWHPYWPFSTTEALRAGYSTSQAVNAGLNSDLVLLNTVHPLLYVQSQYNSPTLVASADAEVSQEEEIVTVKKKAPSRAAQLARLQSRTAERARLRLARRQYSLALHTDDIEPINQPEPSGDPLPIITNRVTVVSADVDDSQSTAVQGGTVESVRITHDGSFAGRGWETLTLELLDKHENMITDPEWKQDIYLRTAYGQAEFRPAVLRIRNFKEGKATVQMLPRGRKTIVITAQPVGSLSRPMQYRR